MNNPSPKSMLVAYSLMNDLAYDFNFIYNSLFEADQLIESYILPYHLNNSSYQSKDINSKYEQKSLFQTFNKKGFWDKLICPNIYALTFLNNRFAQDLEKSNNPDNSFYKLGKVKILWTNIKNLETKKDVNKYTFQSNQKILSNDLIEENPLKLIEGKYQEIEISLKDLALLNFGILKNENYNITPYLIENILQYSIFHGIPAEEKKTLKEIGLKGKNYVKEVLELVDNKELFPYLYGTFINGYNTVLNPQTLPLFLVENLHENSLYTISNNLSNKTSILSELFNKTPELIKEAFPFIWKSLTDTNIKDGQTHNFLNNPERIINVLHKLGFNREDISKLDKKLDYFLSNFLLENGNLNIFNELKKIELFGNDWVNNHIKVNWKSFKENNPDNLIEFLNILDLEHKKSVFDIVSKDEQKTILDFIIEKGSDQYIELAIQSDNFDNNIFNEIIKIGKIKGTYLHKLAKEGKNKTLLTALMNGANLNIPANNTLTEFLSSHQKYQALLEEVNNFVLYDKLDKETSIKILPLNIKKKI